MQKRNRIHENISLCVWLRIDAVKTVRITFIYTHQGDCVCCIFFFAICPSNQRRQFSSTSYKRKIKKQEKRPIDSPHLYSQQSLSLHIPINRNLHSHSCFSGLSGIRYEIVLAISNVNARLVIRDYPFAFRFCSQVIEGKRIGLN